MKKVLGLISVFALAFLLSACGSEGNNKKVDGSSTSTEKSSSSKESSDNTSSTDSDEPEYEEQNTPTADEIQASIDAEDARLEAEWQQQLKDNAAESAHAEAEAQRIQAEQQAAADAESARAEAEWQAQQQQNDAENQRMAELDKANGY